MLPGIAGLLAGVGGASAGVFVPSARYWRLFILSNSDDTQWVAAAEIEMAESAGGADVTSSAFAIGSNHGKFTDFPVANAFANDGATSIWQYGNGGASGYHYGKWIGQDFGAGNSKSIREIRVLPSLASSQLGRFFLQYSATGTEGSWITVCSFKDLAWTAGVSKTFNVDAPSTIALGPERLVDAGFDVPASWSATGGWSISGSAAVGVNAADSLSQANVFVNGSRYAISFPYTATPNTGKFRVRANSAGSNLILTGALVASGYVDEMAIADGTGFFVQADTNVYNGNIPNITVKEILNW